MKLYLILLSSLSCYILKGQDRIITINDMPKKMVVDSVGRSYGRFVEVFCEGNCWIYAYKGAANPHIHVGDTAELLIGIKRTYYHPFLRIIKK